MQIVAIARSCVNTPYHHQGRKLGIGIDCIGLLQEPARRLGITNGYDRTNYPAVPDGVTLQRELLKAGMVEIPVEEMDVGDAPAFWYGRGKLVRHAGIVTPTGLVHTWTGVGRVVEHGFDSAWWRRLAIVYRYPGVIKWLESH